MTTLMLAPSANLPAAALAEILHRPPQVTARADRDVAAILATLWEETEHRAQRPARPWASPQTPPWILRSVTDFARTLLHDLAGGAPNLLVIHPGTLTHLPALRRLLPEQPVRVLARDGTRAPSPVHDALGGLAWARRWADSIGEDAEIIAMERITTANTRGTLLAPLASARLPPGSPLSGEALAGFACWEPAREAMARCGYAPPPRPAAPPAHPALIAAYAQGEAPDAAVAWLKAALREQPDGRLWVALGDRLAEGKDLSGALVAWRAAVESRRSPPRAWRALLAHPERDDALPHLGAACRHRDASVRAAAARWLVARGMDEEAAEALTQVRDDRWYAATDPISSGHGVGPQG